MFFDELLILKCFWMNLERFSKEPQKKLLLKFHHSYIYIYTYGYEPDTVHNFDIREVMNHSIHNLDMTHKYGWIVRKFNNKKNLHAWYGMKYWKECQINPFSNRENVVYTFPSQNDVVPRSVSTLKNAFVVW